MLQLAAKLVASMVTHPVLWSGAAIYIFSNIVSGLPAPNEKNGTGYRVFFAVSHALAASLPRLVAVMFPAFAAKFAFLSTTGAPDATGADKK